MIIVLLAVVLLIVGSIHYYLWRRLVRDVFTSRRARVIGTVVTVVLAVLIPVTMVASRTLPLKWQPLLAWPGFLWLALMFYLLVTLGLLELPRVALRRWVRRAPAAQEAGFASTGHPQPVDNSVESPVPAVDNGAVAVQSDVDESRDPRETPGDNRPAPVDNRFDPSRRLLLGRTMAATASVLSVGAVGIGTWQAKSAPVLKRVPIALPKLPASMSGFKIALVSDIHLGPLLGKSHTERIVRIINSVDADIVAVVGDLVDGSVAELGPAAEPLQDLKARHGSYFVTGNHEYFSGHEEWINEVNSLGVRVLRNERLEIEGIDLAGVNDVAGADVGDGPDFAKTFAGRDTSRPAVLLAHQPVQATDAAKHGVDLQLSGHTHGGQMVPFNLLVGLESPVVAGLGNVDGTQVYVTRGAGFWGPPVRFGAPPDISVIELRGA